MNVNNENIINIKDLKKKLFSTRESILKKVFFQIIQELKTTNKIQI